MSSLDIFGKIDIDEARDKQFLRKLEVLVIGIGEVGARIFNLVSEYYTAKSYDITDEEAIPDKSYDVLHICFPYGPDFEKQVLEYVHTFCPELLIIESTVLPGTTRSIAKKVECLVANSPVRGNVRHGLSWGLLAYTKFIGPMSREAGIATSFYYEYMKIKTRICEKPEDTEWAKILNTTYWGLLIAWYQDIERLSEEFNLDTKEIINFFETTDKESGGKAPRPVLWVGPAGGHCIIPNARLLLTKYDSNFVENIVRSQLTFEASMKSVFGFGEIDGCPLCGRVYTRNIHRNVASEPFYIIQCLTCREPMVVFRQHSATRNQIKFAVKVAKTCFPKHEVDLEMSSIPQHTHFHLRKVNEMVKTNQKHKSEKKEIES